MRHFSKWALAINVVLALCFHSYAVWYIFELHGQAWAIAGLLLPGVSELALCFSSVYEHDMIFNRYTIPFFSYLLLAFAVRFVLEDLSAALRRRSARPNVAEAENPLVLEAVQAMEHGDYKRACRSFLAVSREEPGNGTAFFGVGTSLLLQGRERHGLRYIETAAFLGCLEARNFLAGLEAQNGSAAANS